MHVQRGASQFVLDVHAGAGEQELEGNVDMVVEAGTVEGINLV